MLTLEQRQRLNAQLANAGGTGYVISVHDEGGFCVLFTPECNLTIGDIPFEFEGEPVAMGTYAHARNQANPNSQPSVVL